MRLTDEELSAIEDQCDGFSMLVLNPSAQLDVRAMLTEIKDRRAADSQRLTEEEKETLRYLVFALTKHRHEPYAYEGEEVDAALELIERLVRQ